MNNKPVSCGEWGLIVIALALALLAVTLLMPIDSDSRAVDQTPTLHLSFLPFVARNSPYFS